MVRVIQISDTHLSPGKQHFVPNWEPVAASLRAQQPDLVIHTGDVTVDAADQEADAAHCAALMRSLGVPVLALPGNHDVGDARDPHQPVNEERLARWRRHFDGDRWVRDIAGWRLIGFNALLLGSGEAAEREQAEWLETMMHEAQRRRLAWFLHRPLFLADRHEGDTGYWSVKPEPRAKLFDLLDRYDVALVASGHLHRWHDTHVNGTRFIWGPATGFLVGPDMHPPMAGAAQLGAVTYAFGDTDVDVTFTTIDGLQQFWIDHVLHEVYPPRPQQAG
jgi:3',5'-cyclic AMP phosphodiesterase CpdA